MKPRFAKEAEIIKFPEPEKKVLDMPSVASYPDFMTGVSDLKARRAKGEISQDSHDKLYTDLIHRFMRKESFETPWFLREYSSLDQAKKEIIQKVQALDLTNKDTGKESADLLDKIYSILNKSNTIGRLQTIVNTQLGSEYKENDLVEIAKTIAGAPMQYKDKLAFVDNLQKDKCINHKLLITPGNHSLDDLVYGSSVNDAVFRHLINYGRGQLSKGPGEHALAIMSQKITVQGKGDINVQGVAVELKMATSTKPGGGGGRLGEIAPSTADMKSIMASIPQIAPAIDQALLKQKSLNVVAFTQIVNQLNLQPRVRQAIGKKVFGKIFGNVVGDLVKVFSQANANPDEVRNQYIKANFDFYKGSEQGGSWDMLCAMSLARRSFAVMSDGTQLIDGTVNLMKNTPAVIPGRPTEMLFQITPR